MSAHPSGVLDNNSGHNVTGLTGDEAQQQRHQHQFDAINTRPQYLNEPLESNIGSYYAVSPRRSSVEVTGALWRSDESNSHNGLTLDNSNMFEDRNHEQNTEKSAYWMTEITLFCQEATIVGLKNMVRPSTTRFRQIMWALLILGGIAFTAYQAFDRIAFYLTYPTNVAVNVRYVDSMRFPMTTICNENRFSKRYADDYRMSSLMKYLFPPLPIPNFVPDFTLYDAIVAHYNPDWLAVAEAATQQPSNAIWSCTFNGKQCDVSADFVRVKTDFNICFSFNTLNSNYTSVQTGANSGLQMILFVNQADYLVVLGVCAGFRILLQEPNEVPLVYELGFKISPGFMTQVAVTVEQLTELPAPYGTCNDTEGYTQTRCLQQCQTDYIVEKCGCKDISMPGDARVCSAKQYYNCTANTMKMFFVDNVASSCNCARQCTKLTYKYTVTQAKFSNLTIAYVQDVRGVTITRDYAGLEVYFSELKYTNTESSVAYDILALMCDVGGALGLILGSTVLTFFEVGDLILTLITASIYRMFKNKTTKIGQGSRATVRPPSREPIAHITQ